MKIVNILKSIVTPSVEMELAKLDAHMLADMGMNTSLARTSIIRIPAEAGVRLV